MAAKKGMNLLPSEKWSEKWPGYIEKENGRLRKPRVWINKQGVKATANSYFVERNCCVCGKPTLKCVQNQRKGLNACCSRECQNALMEKPDGHKKSKRGGEDSHVMVKSKSHPNADRTGMVPEHRLVMEAHLGRYLKRSEHVHHINLLKNDNRIENLFLFEGNSKHHLSHGSLNKCVAKLIEAGVLIFNRQTGFYEASC